MKFEIVNGCGDAEKPAGEALIYSPILNSACRNFNDQIINYAFVYGQALDCYFGIPERYLLDNDFELVGARGGVTNRERLIIDCYDGSDVFKSKSIYQAETIGELCNLNKILEMELKRYISRYVQYKKSFGFLPNSIKNRVKHSSIPLNECFDDIPG